jgi:hypothetical protein
VALTTSITIIWALVRQDRDAGASPSASLAAAEFSLE